MSKLGFIRLFLTFLLALPALVYAQKTALVVHDLPGFAATDAQITANLTAQLVGKGFTVTSAITVPSGSLATYQQIWDLRAVTALSTTETTAYLTYLGAGKSLFLMGENTGIGAVRDASLISFVASAGGGALTLTTPSNSQTVQPPFTGPSAVTTLTFRASGGVTSPPGNGAFVTKDGANRGAAIAFGPGNLTAAATGSLIIVFDVNFLDNSATAAEQALTSNLIEYLAAPVSLATTPTVASIAPSGSPAASSTSVNFVITFSEAVSGVDAGDFSLTSTGSAAGTLGTPVTSNSGLSWTVPVTGISGVGTLRVDLKSSGTGIVATAAGNTAIAGGFTTGTAHTVNIPAVVNGSCGTANGVATAFTPATNLCTAGTLTGSVVSDSPWTWTCGGTNGGTNASCSAPNGTTTSGTGSTRATTSGGGWVVDLVGVTNGLPNTAGPIGVTGSAKSPPVAAPAGFSFPHGLYDFTLTGGAGPATVVLTYPTPLPANAVFWKFGKTSPAAAPAWYQFPGAVFSADRLSITLTLTDGALGDDDGTVNGLIADPGGPGVPIAAAASIPTLSEWGVMILSALMLLLGAQQLRRRQVL